jgi:hypothetical protein
MTICCEEHDFTLRFQFLENFNQFRLWHDELSWIFKNFWEEFAVGFAREDIKGGCEVNVVFPDCSSQVFAQIYITFINQTFFYHFQSHDKLRDFAAVEISAECPEATSRFFRHAGEFREVDFMEERISFINLRDFFIRELPLASHCC